MATTRRRKILYWLSGLLVFVVMLLASFPLWFPWVLKPMSSRYGLNYSDYERVGYSKFGLKDVSYTNDSLTFSAKKLQALQPMTWAWASIISKPQNETFVTITKWNATVKASAKKEKSPSTPYELIGKTEGQLPLAEKWLPKADLFDGRVEYSNQVVTLPEVIWNRGVLKGRIFSPEYKQTVDLSLDAKQAKQADLQVTIQPFDGRTTLHITKTSSSLQLNGQLFWNTNRIDLTAEFPPGETLPANATAKSQSFRVPADLIKLKGYNDIAGSFSALWTNQQFTVDSTVAAEPTQRATKETPPLEAKLRAVGTTNSVRFEALHISAPWLNADLSKGAEFSFKGQLLSPQAEFKVVADLSEQTFVPVTGRLEGEAILRGQMQRFPDVSFRLEGTRLSGYKLETSSLALKGDLHWPKVNIEEASIQFADGGTADVKGGADLEGRSVTNLSLRVSGAVAKKLLPANLDYDKIFVAADLNGPLEHVSHTGHVRLEGLKTSALPIADLTLNWRGHWLDFEKLNANVFVKNSSVHLDATAKVATNHVEVQLNELVLQSNKVDYLTLQNPSIIIAQKTADSINSPWRLDIAPLELQGPTRALSIGGNITWPQHGTFSVSATNLAAADFRDFTTNALPKAKLDFLKFSGAWTNGPVTGAITARGTYTATNRESFNLDIAATADSSGIMISNLTVFDRSAAIIAGQGKIPATIEPAEKKMLQLDMDQRIDFHGVTQPNKPFWDEIAKISKVRLTDPRAEIAISGSLAKPVGKITIEAKEIASATPNKKLPPARNIHGDIELTREQVRLTELELFIENQPVLATALIPIEPNHSFKEIKKLIDPKKASGRLQIPNAHIATFAPFAPNLLTPQGTLDVDIQLNPGLHLSGGLTIKNAATYPLASTGALHDLQARLRFDDRVVQFDHVSGILGGEPVNVTGNINLAQFSTNGLPAFDINFRGENIPLAQNADVILHADIDVGAANSATNHEPIVSGLVHLRDSFFLGDIKMLLPGKVAKPSERPPYFSVDKKPFADWLLRVRVTGKEFLKVSTPFFKGSTTADLRIFGPLREPIALGDVKIEKGQILLPFANLNVQQGFVSLTAEDPYHPHIFALAGARTFGYDVQMTANGPADKPVLEFSSTPPLSSEQILLMVTAGQVPNRDIAFSNQQKASKFAMFLGKSFLSKFSSGGGAERLTITSGENVTEQGRETYDLEYKLTDNVSFVGEYDRFGDLNAGIKWRVYSK